VALSQAALIKHPIVQFAQDNVNFSINTDDTTVTDSPLENEYQLLRSWGFNEVHFTRAVSNSNLELSNC
jgi:adenosine deaminase